MSKILDLLIRVKDEASASLDRISGSTSGDGSGVAGLADNMLALGAQATIAGMAIKKAGTFVNDQLDDWQQYVFTVDNLAQAFGMNLRETEQLVYISDTYKISNDALFSTLNKLAREGFGTGAEALNGLREEFQKIEDPAERATYLFGMAGEQGQKALGPLMNMTDLEWSGLMEGIESLGGIDEEMVGNARELELATQGMKQAWTELMIKLANFSAPGVTAFLQLLQGTYTPETPISEAGFGQSYRDIWNSPLSTRWNPTDQERSDWAETQRWERMEEVFRNLPGDIKDAVERND